MSTSITLKDVARHAGVSATTASRSLTRPDRVNEDTRTRVLEAVQALGYTGNELARSLRQQSSRTIGLIISDLLNPFHAQMASGLEREAAQRGYSALLCTSDEDIGKERGALDLLRRQRVCGVVLEPTEGSRAEVERLVRSGLPVVEVDRISGAAGTAAVLSDNVVGAASAARHLLALGHRCIGTVAGDPSLTSGRERLEGLRAELERAGVPLPDRWVVTARYTAEDGYRAATALLSRQGPRPSALFVANIEMAVGTLQAIHEANLRVPTDISVVSFDDARWATLIAPPLTVIAQDAARLGRMAAQLVIDAVTGTARGVGIHRLPTILISRGSCQPPST